MNGWLAIPSGFAAEVMAQCGFDSITVDMQHGAQDFQSMLQCFQAMQAHPVTPMVRVPWNEPGIIGKVLDAGAMGVSKDLIFTAEKVDPDHVHIVTPSELKRWRLGGQNY